jgi:hypothetical protein
MFKELTNQELYRKAKRYGSNAILWRRKFTGLLPEVNRRRLYEQKGFSSIFEFAFKLAGLSEEQVRRALNLGKKFSGLPVLKELLESGEVSVNKLARVASIATPENEAELAAQVKLLPNRAVETLVRDEKGLGKPLFDAKSVHVHTFQFGEKLTERLSELQGKGLDLDQILNELLDKREEEIAEQKVDIAAHTKETSSRYIPSQTKQVIYKEHGSKCSIATCKRPAQHLHHTQTFALSRRHDPHYLAPLCKEHHTIAHGINLKVLERRSLAVK